MSPYLVYCAGPMAGLTFEEAEEWRNDLSFSIGDEARVLSPLRGKDILRGSTFTPHGYENLHPLATQKAITNRDRNDVTRADLIFVNLLGATRVSIGTMFELAWADLARIPIVLLIENDGSNPHDHCMVREVSPFVADNLKEGIEITRYVLGI